MAPIWRVGLVMNRPVAAAEPSMDEILASIRKIIAEEPIGTRPGPDRRSPLPELKPSSLRGEANESSLEAPGISDAVSGRLAAAHRARRLRKHERSGREPGIPARNERGN